MLFQPSNISPDEIYGTGTVDLTQGMTISWRVAGNSAMTDYQIVFYENNAASTQLYTTGKVTLSTPFWGTDYNGETQYFSVTIAAATLSTAGMSNGNEYKFLITQWWGNESVAQLTASVFQGRTTPTVSISAISNPVTTKNYTFTGNYSQAQGDSIKWLRWQISESSNTADPFIDTGRIYGTGQLQVEYDGFLTGTEYAICLTVESASGQEVTTGWVTFTVTYSVAASTGSVSACRIAYDSAIWVHWDRVLTADGYSIMRQTVGESRLEKIADVDSSAGQIRDYSARSGQTYIYYVFPSGELEYLTEPMQSDPVEVKFWFWTIIEAVEIGKNAFSAMATHVFRYGNGGVSEGNFSNNNSPNIMQNFTRYPTRQGSSANYLTGSVSGYIGSISKNTVEYSDTLAQSQAVMDLSNSTNALFLVDPKGHFLRIHTAGAVSLSIDNKKKEMPQTVTVPWVEVGNAENVHIIMYPGGDFYPVDRVILSSLRVDPQTGKLLWTRPDDYTGTGSTFSLTDGVLSADTDGPFNSATIALDAATATVTATVS